MWKMTMGYGGSFQESFTDNVGNFQIGWPSPCTWDSRRKCSQAKCMALHQNYTKMVRRLLNMMTSGVFMFEGWPYCVWSVGTQQP